MDQEVPLLSRRPYRFYLAGRFCATLASTSQAVVIAWEVYEAARRTMSVAEASFVVGMIGLAQFLPLFALTLVAGETADRYDRRRVLAICYSAQLLVSAGLASSSVFDGGLWPIFTLAAMFGIARAFFQPTASALGPMLVLPHQLPRAIATNSLVAQVGNISGPALGGLLCAVSPAIGYGMSAVLYAVSIACTLLIRAETRPIIEAGRSRAAQIREGLGYVWRNKLVLGAISLDLFAVLLGGATGFRSIDHFPLRRREQFQCPGTGGLFPLSSCGRLGRNGCCRRGSRRRGVLHTLFRSCSWIKRLA
jgi:MFS family permease